MIDKCFRVIKLPISYADWEKLPRNAAYKYEYFDDKAWLTPRPKGYHAILRLKPMSPPAVVDAQWNVSFRPLEAGDWRRLPSLMAAAFDRQQPFGSLPWKPRVKAARECLQYTRRAGNGPLIREACFVGVTDRRRAPAAAILISLVPNTDLTEFNSYHWYKKPPRDAIKKRLGRPHLTWVFVPLMLAGYGVGTALLAHAAEALRHMGFTELVSTFLAGNESSALWHWRNGFELLPYPGSNRLWRERRKETYPTLTPPPSPG